MAQRLDDLVWFPCFSTPDRPTSCLWQLVSNSRGRDLRCGETIEVESREVKTQLADGQQQGQRRLIAYEQGAIEMAELVSRRESNLDGKADNA